MKFNSQISVYHNTFDKKRNMETSTFKQNKSVDTQFKQTLKELNKAEIAAWGLFIGVGILYIVLSLMVAI